MRILNKILIVCSILLSISHLSEAQNRGEVPGKYIIKFKNDYRSQNFRQAQSNNQLNKLAPVQSSLKGAEQFDDYYIYNSIDSSETISEVKNRFGSDKIESIEPDYYLEMFDLPNDFYFDNQWYLRNTGQEYFGIDRYNGEMNDSLVLKTGTVGIDVNITPQYFASPAEKTKVIVAIVDTGVDIVHPELIGKIWVNEDEVPNNGLDDDHNGFIDDYNGYDLSGDFMDILNPIPDNDPTDSIGHGTHCAGIIAAQSNNGNGIAGIAQEAYIMPVKISPNMTTATGAQGIIYAVNNGAKIINLSWGGAYDSGILRTAVKFAFQNGVAMFAAAGNFGNTDRYYPASYDEVVTIAAGNSDGYLTYFTTYGSHVELVAPGEDILSLRAQGTDLYGSSEPYIRIIGDDSLYYLSDGTSMASPVAAGVAAYIWSIRPDLSLEQLKQVLYDGADDMIDPFNEGDILPGKDTLSGYGYINLTKSIDLISQEGISLIEPEQFQRYMNDVEVKVNTFGDYHGSWILEYSLGRGDTNWVELASGLDIPTDSILYTFTDMDLSGEVNLRLTDKFDNYHYRAFTYVRENKVDLSEEMSTIDYKYNVPINGSIYGPDYDSLKLYFETGGFRQLLNVSSGEYFDSLIYLWTLSGIDTGNYNIILDGYYNSGLISDTVNIYLGSVFRQGWPVNLGTRGALSPSAEDLDNDGVKEIIVSTLNGLYVFNNDGTIVDGFPVREEFDMRCMPAFYDVDRDGFKEIIVTDSTGLHVFNNDGSYVDGWPVKAATGVAPLGLGYPNPTVTKLGYANDSAIVYINIFGNIIAYNFDGSSYFYSLEGYFGSFNPRLNYSSSVGQSLISFVSSRDFDDDGLYEVLASYSSAQPFTGLGLFDGRTGQPMITETDPVFLRTPILLGTVLSDLDGDQKEEIISVGFDSTYLAKVWVRTQLHEDFNGWPVSIPEINNQKMIGTYPTIADLDLDNDPEIIFSFIGFNLSYLFIFNSDGTPYKQVDGVPYGVAFVLDGTLGNTITADLDGDEYPEIIARSGYILPNTGNEKIYILNRFLEQTANSPIYTPARPLEVLSTRFAPLVDDVDGDGLVELILISDNNDLLFYDFNSSSRNGDNKGRIFGDNLNSNSYDINKNPTDIDDDLINLPDRISLSQNYPNPFNPTTEIGFSIPAKSEVRLEIYNILGQKVATLVDGQLSAGQHLVEFDASEFSSGVYLYQLKTDETNISKKMVLVK